MKLRFRKNSGPAVTLAVVLTLGAIAVPTPAFAAPTGTFGRIELVKQADGYSFSNNPVDDNYDNGVVAINDYVGFKIGTDSPEAVDGATVSITKPSCWIWDAGTINAALNFNLDGGATQGSVSGLDTDTIVISNWKQAESGTLLTQEFKVKAGPGCENGSTWTPQLEWTDASGSHSQALDTITVQSVPGSDLRIAHDDGPTAPMTRWFANLGNVPTIRTGWRVYLSPETLSSVGYADPSTDEISFKVSFSGPASTFELPKRLATSCWSYSPAIESGNGFDTRSSQTLTIKMKKTATCIGLLTQQNSIWIDSYTPLTHVQNNNCAATLTAEVAAGPNWVDAWGRPIPDNPLTNNADSVNLECSTVEYGWKGTHSLFSPTKENASYDVYPKRDGDAVSPTGDWEVVSGAQIGEGASFISVANFDFDNPSLENYASYHLWDATKQQLDMSHFDKAVTGPFSVNSSLSSFPYSTEKYVKECTTEFNGANANNAGTLTWGDCTVMDPTQINGLRFRFIDTVLPYTWNANFPNAKSLFSQVPFIAVAPAVVDTKTQIRWTSSSFPDASATSRGSSRDAVTTIVGNKLLIAKRSDKDQVQPQESIKYTIEPQVFEAKGTFLPSKVSNLKVVDTVDKGVVNLDFSGLDPFWNVDVEDPMLGADGIPYTADDADQSATRGYRLTFTPRESVDTDTVLPSITYTAAVGILLPPSGNPYLATIKNTAVISADGNFDTATARTASKLVTATTPEAAFFSKGLISDPVIEVEDQIAAWRVHWVNYNNYSLGQGTFVDVFPWNGDDRLGNHSNFDGSIVLQEIGRVGATQRSSTVIELSADIPSSIGQSPATATTWVQVDPTAGPDQWIAALGGEQPTAIRVTVPNIEASTQGYGALELKFKVVDQTKNDIYYNDASGTVVNPNTGRVISLGDRVGDPVSVIGSSISGVAFIDKNGNGLRDDDEPLLANVPVMLYRDGYGSNAFRSTVTGSDGAYMFDNLHSSNPVVTYAPGGTPGSSDYQVVFDPNSLNAMGYKLTTKQVDNGVSSEKDSDADEITGRVDAVTLNKAEDLEHLDAGVLAIGPQASITAYASMDRVYNWDVEKRATNKADLTVGDDGAATIEYQAVISQVDYNDSNAKLDGDITITNPSDDKTYTVAASVAVDGTGVTCTVKDGVDRVLAPLATLTLPYTCAGLPGDDLDRTTTATVRVVDRDPLGTVIPDLTPAANVSYSVNELRKKVTVQDIASVGGSVQPATDFGPFTWGDNSDGVYTEDYDLDVTVPAGDCLTVVNTATILETGQNDTDSLRACLPLDLTVSKNVVMDTQTSYGWNIEKSLINPDVALDSEGKATLKYEVTVTEKDQTDAASTMSGTVAVANPNKYKSVDVSLSDVVSGLDGNPVCTFAAGSTVTIAAGESRDLAYSCVFETEPTIRDGLNTVTVTWDSDLAGTNQASLSDTGKTSTASAEILAKDWLVKEFQKTVSLSDTMSISGTNDPVRSFGPYTWSGVGTIHTETYEVPVEVKPGTCEVADNTAVLAADGTTVGKASTSHKLCNETALTVDDLVTASLQRTYNWDIDKRLTNRDSIAADKTPQSVDSKWQIKVTEMDYDEALHQVSGRVIITNPNDFKSFNVEVTEGITIDGVDCSPADATSVMIPPNQSAELPYTCDGNPGAIHSGEHTVEVTGADIDTIHHTQAVEYMVNEVNKVVNVTDDRFVFSPEWTIEWSKSGEEHMQDYTLPVTTQPGACQTYTNTALVVQTGQAASDQFKICAPAVTPATDDPSSTQLAKTGATGVAAIGISSLLALGVGMFLRRRRV